MKNPLTFSLPVNEFRSQPIPVEGLDRKSIVLSDCFVSVDFIPPELQEWLGINPRIPKFTNQNKLTGTVAKEIVKTLREQPEKFVFKNQGIYISVAQATHEKQRGGDGLLTLTLDDKARHGVLNGGHTLRAILEARDSAGVSSSATAYVRLHIYQLNADRDKQIEGDLGIELITDIAEGLNRTLQVDEPSLEDLKGSFDRMKKILKGKPGSEQIAYHQGDSGNIDVVEVLTLCSFFNLNKYPDRRTHPQGLFGRRKVVLSTFLEDTNDPDSAFDRILPNLHEILAFSERVQQVIGSELGKIEKSNRKINWQSDRRDGYFISGQLTELPLGFTYPLLAAFRANVCPEAWRTGRFEWLEEPESLLQECASELARVIHNEYRDNNGRIAEVGRKAAAYSLCYGIVVLTLVELGKWKRQVS